MKPDWQDVVVFLVFFLLTVFLEQKYKLILLGSSLLFFAPFIVLERHAFPVLRKYPKLTVVFGMLAAFFGGITLSYGVVMP